MGRPIKKRFFGASNPPYFDVAHNRTGTGGEGIANVFTWAAGTGSNYSQGVTASISAPQITGGIQAVVNPVVNSAGTLTSFTIVTTGTGYNSTSGLIVKLIQPATQTATLVSTASLNATSLVVSGVNGIYVGMTVQGVNLTSNAATATIKVASISGNTVNLTTQTTATVTASTVVSFVDAGTGATVTATNIVLTKTQGIQTINFTAYLSTGSSAIGNGDIIKQEGSRSYLVQNAQGRGRVKLASTSSLTSGTMYIIATDFGGAQYFINKLTSRRAHLVQYQLNGASKYLINFESTGTTAVAKWSTLSNTAITGTNIVSIATTV